MAATIENPSPEPQRSRLRFSLRTLILATAMFCLVLSHVLTSVELHSLRKEARRLRDELGELTVTDKTKLHVLALQPELSYATKRWRWRVHFPAGRTFRVCYKFTDLPHDGVPDDLYEFFDDVEGELTLTASCVLDSSGVWKLVVHRNPVHTTLTNTRTQTIANPSWLDDNTSMAWSQAGSRTTDSVEPGEPMILLRLRRTKSVTVAGGASGTTVDMNPTVGLMIWIEEAN